MNFSIRRIINRLFAPRHELSCPSRIWKRLLIDLHRRGRGRHESGAFLLGTRDGDGRRHIRDYVLYDDLDPHALDTGIVRLDGSYFGQLWDICRARGLTVVADVHTHPHGARQSKSDQSNPIISRAGHIALIVPRLAAPPVSVQEIGIYRYLGGYRWDTIHAAKHKTFLHIGI